MSHEFLKIRIISGTEPLNWPEERPDGYDETVSPTDVDIISAGGGRYGQHLIVIGHNCIYFSEI